LVAISGLHMALFAGVVFWVVCALLALSPGLAVTRPIKKRAALAAIASGFFYLLISGMGLATQRAFIMITIMLVAVLIDRPALTMRNVALAAWVILLARAESIMSVSFQMSFMAVVWLVGVYEWRAQVKAHRAREYTPGILASAWRYGAGLMLTTLVAGAATAPIAAYQFNRVAVYGVLANLAAVPVVGALVMPMAVLALVFLPFGLEAYPLWVMG
jgi:competence protein ComEC